MHRWRPDRNGWRVQPVLAVVVASPLAASGSLDPQGPVARSISGLWHLMLALGTAVFVLVGALLVGALFRRRRAETGEKATSRWLVAGGVAMPAVILAIVYGGTLVTMRRAHPDAPPDAEVVEVTGHQWWWEVEYPNHGVVTANEIHVPAGEPVVFRVTSVDVIHSLWIPSLGGKMDLLPDHVNVLVVEADGPGEHRADCAEFCGLQHARMGLLVVAATEDDFAEWIEARRRPGAAPADSTAARGQEVFTSSGCGECHTIRGTEATGDVGPDLTHFASRPRLGAGVAPNTTERLTAWISDPHELKRGVDMPASELSDEDLAAVVAYLEGLE